MQQGYIPDKPQPYQLPSLGQGQPQQPPFEGAQPMAPQPGGEWTPQAGGQWAPPPPQYWQPAQPQAQAQPQPQPYSPYPGAQPQPYAAPLSPEPLPLSRQRRSLWLLAAGILGLAYFIFLIVYFYIAVPSSAASELGEGLGQFALALAYRMITPHIIGVALAVIANAVAWWTDNKWLALAAAVLYLVAALLFLNYWFFVLPSFLLCLWAAYQLIRRDGPIRA